MVNPICYIETPFYEKFGVPRQPLLVSEAWGKLVFPKDDFYVEAFRGIEQFSHLWLIFQFHAISESEVKALVRPPRFKQKKKLGVFATRSPHRPNRLGLSVVKFDRLEILDQQVILWVMGVDLVNGTPIFDIKPYLPYADRVDEAQAQTFDPPQSVSVKWACEPPSAKSLIEKVLALDPRPGHQKDCGDEFGLSIAGYNVRFRFVNSYAEVVSVEKIG